MTDPIVRRARPGDEHDILRLIHALAVYERAPDAVEATPEGLAALLFGDGAKVFAHVAEQGGRVVGIAVWFFNFSTWTGRHGLYLEDLFVDPDARGGGVARALFQALGREAEAHDCARIDWGVLDWNELAKGFYRRLGGRHMEGWEPWRLDGDALAALKE
ncbi:GNAT family N-acetyltransferase [Sphingomonas sp. C8-2]|jgi:GNAT superfamily N-acetyltransferase|uniref:Ribosomal protein S18 acetylase RimI n=1 Tax=Rhizorhabdus histidinilytica TaxID=439228 RepID=A0A1T5FZS3_9SPHN|nr:GNAT family N-acetyltransferase [Rhizorhabdus histidinilytica]QEH81466.1 GNAT family N-acetyltransferase [Sphingomonas sp. C8-2]SKC01688.1 Ribosomal protein S18 acetylase RimI [Rhizorhabdus histidinilytica]